MWQKLAWLLKQMTSAVKINVNAGRCWKLFIKPSSCLENEVSAFPFETCMTAISNVTLMQRLHSRDSIDCENSDSTSLNIISCSGLEILVYNHVLTELFSKKLGVPVIVNHHVESVISITSLYTFLLLFYLVVGSRDNNGDWMDYGHTICVVGQSAWWRPGCKLPLWQEPWWQKWLCRQSRWCNFQVPRLLFAVFE